MQMRIRSSAISSTSSRLNTAWVSPSMIWFRAFQILITFPSDDGVLLIYRAFVKTNELRPLFLLFEDGLDVLQLVELFCNPEPGGHPLKSFLPVSLLPFLELLNTLVYLPVLHHKIPQVGDMHPGVGHITEVLSHLSPVVHDHGFHHLLRIPGLRCHLRYEGVRLTRIQQRGIYNPAGCSPGR